MLGFSALASTAITSSPTSGKLLSATADLIGSSDLLLSGEVFSDITADVSGGSVVFAAATQEMYVTGDLVGRSAITSSAYALYSVECDVSGSSSVDGDAVLVYPQLLSSDLSGSGILVSDVAVSRYGPVLVKTPRPPVGLNLGYRVAVDASDWFSIAQTFEYSVPALFSGRADDIRSNRFTITAAIASTDEVLGSVIEMRVVDGQNDPFAFRTRVLSSRISVDGLTELPVRGMTLSGQEILEARVVSGGSVYVSVGVVANTREYFDVIQ
jgi:hypothetical protein